MRLDLEKFRKWIEENKMYIYPDPDKDSKGNKIVTLCDCKHDSRYYDESKPGEANMMHWHYYRPFDLVSPKSGQSMVCSLSGRGKTSEEAIFSLLRELLCLSLSNFKDPFEKIENTNCPEWKRRKINIPEIEYFLT